MDRKSKQKIISVALLLVFLAAMGIVFACGWKQEQALRNKQQEELEIIYPEIKEEQISEELKRRIRNLTKMYGRISGQWDDKRDA